MIRKTYIGIYPSKGNTHLEQFGDCLNQLSSNYLKSYNHKKELIKLNIFVNVQNNDEYIKIKQELSGFITEFFDKSTVPPSSIICQPPSDDKLVVIEATLAVDLNENYIISHKSENDSNYIVIEYGHIREIFVSGISSDLNNSIEKQSQDCFEKVKIILEKEELSFSNIVRQWNFLENITEVKNYPISTSNLITNSGQHYQIFNNTRSDYYDNANWENGYPAATGIGMNAGGIMIDFMGISYKDIQNPEDIGFLKIIAIKNPRQTDAHQYSEKVLAEFQSDSPKKKGTPKFERAKLIQYQNGWELYISGTAAIIGENSVTSDDIETQTRTTIENIKMLIPETNIIRNGFDLTPSHSLKERGNLYNGFENSPLPWRGAVGKVVSYFRVYVKHERDIPKVKAICEEYFPDASIIYLLADICREELLVEIEGVVQYINC